jgi:predicted site-specific integrase-resolvase
MFKRGELPTKQLPSGTVLVRQETPHVDGQLVLYGRVSTQAQKPDLERQMGRLRDFSAAQGWKVAKEVLEVGSGLNGRRKKLLTLLSNPSVATIVVEHRDRLSRFGSEYIIAALSAQGRQIVIINDSDLTDDLVQDMIDVLTSFCARLYGRRAAKNKAKKAVEAVAQ